jgi:xanthine phosphoribosyltransferase
VIEKLYYSYDDCIKDCKSLIPRIKIYNPDAIIAIARGGMTLAQLISEAINLRDIYTINSISYDEEQKFQEVEIFNIPDIKNKKTILIVDDIIDSGETMNEVIKIFKQKYPNIDIKCLSIFYKDTAVIKPDFAIKQTTQWIDFFWEVDLKK